MNKRFYCPHCGEHCVVRDFMKAYYVEFNAETGEIEYGESKFEPNIEDSSTEMYCEMCWDFIKLEEIEDQIESYKKDKKIKDLEDKVNKLERKTNE